jgi:hypothetical protein
LWEVECHSPSRDRIEHRAARIGERCLPGTALTPARPHRGIHTRHGLAFVHGDPLLLTIVGEFVVKNLVLVAAGIAVCTWREQ